MWYRTIATEIELTWGTMPSNLARLPIFGVLIALHWPLIRYFKDLTKALADVWHRRLTVAGIGGISLGYVMIGVVVFDYSRWFSSWAVCMILVLHAVKSLPALVTVRYIANNRANSIWGWLVTAVPRVGTAKPF
jgi:hypothetical protein